MDTDQDFYKQIGNRVKALRHERGWSQATLANNVGVASSYINRIELAGRRPTIDTLGRIADVFGVPLWRLFADQRLTADEQQWGRAVRDLAQGADDLAPRDLRVLTKLAERLRDEPTEV